MTKAIGTGGTLTTLTQIGVGFQRDGQLALDSTKLSTALTSNFSEMASLFARTGKATDTQIAYSGSTIKTQAGSYAVNVTTLSPLVGTINGQAATTVGNSLVGAVGDASEGLNITVSGVATGSRGTVNFTIGYAAQLDDIVTNLLGSEGILTAKTDGINNSISRLDKQAEALTVRLTSIEKRYREQFTRLDTLLSSMSKTSSFLTQQLAAINANK